MANKMECMLAVLGDIYAEHGISAVLAKVDKWQENGWLYPYEKCLLLDSIAFRVPQFPGYIEKEKR